MSLKNPKARIARWIFGLQDFDFVIKHRPGRMNRLADLLSRDCAVHVAEEKVGEIVGTEEMKKLQRADPSLAPIVLYLEQGILPENSRIAKSIVLGKESFALDEKGILFYVGYPSKRKRSRHERLAIPEERKKIILFECHDSVFAAHLGFERTLKRVQASYWWDHLYKEVKEYVQNCVACRRKKPTWIKTRGEPESIVIREPWDKCGIDFVGPLPTTKKGNRYVLVLRDYSSGWAESKATVNATAETTAAFMMEVIHRHGSTKEMVSDNGPAFDSKLYKIMCSRTGTTGIKITPYNPGANGLTERWNSVLIQMLRFYINDHRDDWEKWLPYVTFAFNTSGSPVTKQTPFFLLHGREARVPSTLNRRFGDDDSDWKTLSRYNKDLLHNVENGKDLALETREKLKRRSERYKKHGLLTVDFEEGDIIFTKVPVTKSKLDDRYEGPFVIIRQVGLNVFLIKKHGQKVRVHVKDMRRARGLVMKEPKIEGEFHLDQWEQREAPLGMTADELVGQMVYVYWSMFKTWYAGRVLGRQGRRHLVKYFHRSLDTPQDEEEIYAERMIGYKRAPKWKLLSKRRNIV